MKKREKTCFTPAFPFLEQLDRCRIACFLAISSQFASRYIRVHEAETMMRSKRPHILLELLSKSISESIKKFSVILSGIHLHFI